MFSVDNLRNVAIIAHVDHGKTTLIDNMLSQSGIFRDNQQVEKRIMDSNALEKERGITILAKNTSFEYQGIKYNIIDTPGHADFGGEVERILSMVDGAILLVDSSEGPMPQTKFVLSKALSIGLKPIVVINKVDRPDRRVNEVIDEIFSLFISLDATDEQLDFPILYAVGKDGWAVDDMDKADGSGNLRPLFDLMSHHVQPPQVNLDVPFSMLGTILTSDPYVGRLLIGKVYSGSAKVGETLKSINLDGELVENFKLTKLFGFRGVERISINEVYAGDIVAIAGIKTTSVADTVCAQSVEIPIDSTEVDPPTMSVDISVNSSPFAGQEGTKVTSRMILDRLKAEAETNVAMSLQISDTGESFEVGGRGELQLGVLIETMRREGFELSVSRPKILFKKDANGALLEPIEEVVVDVDEEFTGIVVEKISARKGEIVDMKSNIGGKARIIFHVPSRGLIGYQAEFRNDTKGTGVLSRLFHEHQKYKGDINHYRKGVLISNGSGAATAYSLAGLEERGVLFVKPKDKLYEGMVVGEHKRDNDLEVNAVKAKQLTNMRASGTDENIKLSPPVLMTLEEMLSYIHEDELVEVTPQSIRLRKKFLNANDRKKYGKKPS